MSSLQKRAFGYGAVVLAAVTFGAPTSAQESCATGKTITDGKLTVATGNPAYYPWVHDDAPESGNGFEAAVAYAVAAQMGFAAGDVIWVRTSFDEAIQPGAKNFDFNMQQYSITEEREKVIDFSDAYYSAAAAILVRQKAIDGGLKPELAALKSLKWGVAQATTARSVVTDIIAPDSDAFFYDDTANAVAAMQADQIDAAIFDLPTALYLSAVVMDDGAVLGQFPAELSENPDQFGLLMADGNPIKECVNEALAGLKADGSMAGIEAEWLQAATNVPLIK